ncbi:HD domain-containing protein [Actinokineospora inagensis]|uniref:HD domain-containing protein n=1 Tax=Actinokineospora inagensis TaxID=103730 RepID=UPI00041AB3DD|nr:HD domain-containing protein [Actinokineospora inagensis]
MDDLLAPVLTAYTATWPGEDTEPITAAYRLAARHHHGQFRHSGEPYIRHSLAVAQILADLGADRDLVCAGLLHDLSPDSRSALSTAVADTLAGLDRLESHGLPAARPVLLLKLADRLHNMRTIAYVRPEKQVRKSTETLRTLVPLAVGLGVDGVAAELATLSEDTIRRSTPRVRSLATAVWLLPKGMRGRWQVEWTAELATLPTRRARARFLLGVLTAVPRIALAHRPGLRWTARLAWGLVGAGALTTVLTSWPAATVALAGLALAAAVLFAEDDRAASRLRDFLDSWRR